MRSSFKEETRPLFLQWLVLICFIQLVEIEMNSVIGRNDKALFAEYNLK